MEDEDLMLLSSLRFAPIDVSPSRVRPKKKTVQGTADQLRRTLQTLVKAHQEALFDIGDVAIVRSEILHVMQELEMTSDEGVVQFRDEINRLLAQREDLDALSTGVAAPLSFKDNELDTKRLNEIDTEVATLTDRLKTLQRERQEIISRRQADERAAVEERAADEARLRAMPSRDEISRQLRGLGIEADILEREATALQEGGERFAQVLLYLEEGEKHLAELLSRPEQNQVKERLQDLSQQLDKDLEYVKERSWNLLEAVIGAEKENCLAALDLVLQKQEVEHTTSQS